MKELPLNGSTTLIKTIVEGDTEKTVSCNVNYYLYNISDMQLKYELDNDGKADNISVDNMQVTRNDSPDCTIYTYRNSMTYGRFYWVPTSYHTGTSGIAFPVQGYFKHYKDFPIRYE
jgi:hypothetical protein